MKNTITVSQIFNDTICPQCGHDSLKKDNEIHSGKYNKIILSDPDKTTEEEFFVLGSEVKLNIHTAIERNEDSNLFSYNLESNLAQYMKRFFHPSRKIGESDVECFFCKFNMLEQFLFIKGNENFPPAACFQEIFLEDFYIKRYFSIDKDFPPIGWIVWKIKTCAKEIGRSSDPSTLKEIFELINKYKSFI